MAETPNRRFELRAYESPNCCRLASFLANLAGEPPQPVDRSRVVQCWTDQYPRHAKATGQRNVRGRITQALIALKAAGIAQAGDVTTATPVIKVMNYELLRIAAGNLSIVEDNRGIAIAPGSWSELPRVPDYLLAIQQALVDPQQVQAAPE